MWRRKKLIIVIAIAIVVLLAGSIGGIVLAQTGTPTPSPQNTLLAKVAAKLGIDQQKLVDAFTQAQKEIRDENLQKRLDALVAQGKMTKEQADNYKKWVESRPSVPVNPGIGGFGGHMRGGFRGFPGARMPQGTTPPTTSPTPAK